MKSYRSLAWPDSTNVSPTPRSSTTSQSSREHFFVIHTSDGHLRINDVPPGTYDLLLQLYEQPAGCLIETVGKKMVRVEVRDKDVVAGGLDLGSIEVLCRSGPKIGQDMRAYQFTDASGREQPINAMRGSSC